MLIYKITNQINNKIYIGLTTTTLKIRWQKHVSESKLTGKLFNNKPLYRAIRKYGAEKFTIEEIARTDDFKELGQLERYYIKLYNSQNPDIGYNLSAGGESNQWDANPAAKLSYDEVVEIRKAYASGNIGPKKCWLRYKDKISFSAFTKVWNGITWPNILSEVFTEENKQAHLKFCVILGENNASAKATDEEVLAMRKYYVDHTLQETYEKFGANYSSIDGFREPLVRTFKHIPIYKKQKKIWVLNGNQIDINNYNPVSTISESGE